MAKVKYKPEHLKDGSMDIKGELRDTIIEIVKFAIRLKLIDIIREVI